MLLPFDDEIGRRRFDFVFAGFVLGGTLQERKGMQVLRTEVALFEKLEALSDLVDGEKLANGEPRRQRKNGDGPHTLQLTLAEFDLLVNYLGVVPWAAGTPAKYAVETIDWLDHVRRESQK